MATEYRSEKIFSRVKYTALYVGLAIFIVYVVFYGMEPPAIIPGTVFLTIVAFLLISNFRYGSSVVLSVDSEFALLQMISWPSGRPAERKEYYRYEVAISSLRKILYGDDYVDFHDLNREIVSVQQNLIHEPQKFVEAILANNPKVVLTRYGKEIPPERLPKR